MQNSSKKNVYFTSLGCSKNLVDSEVMLGYLDRDGFCICHEPQKADVIIVNTCSFVEAAKQESIEVILELADYKMPDLGKCQVLVVAGCMAQRYSGEIEKELPEVDLIIGTGEYHKIVTFLAALDDKSLDKKSFVAESKYIHTELDPRINTSPFYTAWLKVSEGCNRNCTFCVIPSIRGTLRSRTVGSLVKEAQNLVAQGVRELNLISQDLSSYGSDLERPNDLYTLLDALEKIEGLDWIRLLYFYPDDLTDKVIDKIATSKKICKYLDMPIQHFSDNILKKMNRKISEAEIIKKVHLLREKVPQIVLRTSIIVGFPGETEDDFGALLNGIKEVKLDHLGVFKYSDEENTPAAKLPGKINPSIIDDRFETVYALQQEILQQLNQKYLGTTLPVLVEGVHEETNLLIKGRHIGQAPDTDGQVIINDVSNQSIKAGDLVQVKITEVYDYDLVGQVIS
ncbi:MAG: 30S ribosomal protein S12 methylthiotransferase RimO [Bacteriovoracaceae bacterium]|nr:30S ribosomal protein S12 methylthiotransferase RimO [Bacteriovoracaceae bacterium]